MLFLFLFDASKPQQTPKLRMKYVQIRCIGRWAPNVCPCNLIFNARRISHLPQVNWPTRAHTSRGECAPSPSWHDGQRIFIARFVTRDRRKMIHARKRANRRPDGCQAGLCGDRSERKTKTQFSVKSARENWARDFWLLVSVTSRPHNDVGSCTAFALFSEVPLRCCGLISVLLLRFRRLHFYENEKSPHSDSLRIEIDCDLMRRMWNWKTKYSNIMTSGSGCSRTTLKNEKTKSILLSEDESRAIPRMLSEFL